ncbi:MAG TPA: trigger factor, partial [Oligoflexia bacterium]|nr:trigger factor [Oligoflexia bacterium]
MSYQASLTERSSCEKSLSLVIDPAAFDERFQKELSRLVPQVQLKGFRPGRAPKAMVRKMYGDRIHSDVLMDIVNSALSETAKENKLDIIGTSDVKIEDSEPGIPISVSMVLSLYPEPELENLSKLEAEVPVKLVTDEIVNERVDNLREIFAKEVDVEDRKVAQQGDLVTFTYTGVFVNDQGEEVQDANGVLSGEHAKAELGKKEIPENLEAAITGMEIDECKVVSHEFGEEASSEVRGKKVLFSISLEKIQKKERPELDDELAAKTGIAENVQGLKDYIRKDIERAFAKENREAKLSALLDAVIKANDFEVPQLLVDDEIRLMLAEMKVLDPKNKNFHRTPVDGFREMLGEQAGRRVKHSVVVRKIIKDKDLKASEE